MADRIINNHQGTRIANALGKVAENVSDYTATQVTPTDAMKGELISESNAERIVDALDSIKDGAVDVAHGGTGAKTASAARSNLGLGALATLDSVSASEVSGLGTAATKDYTTSVSSGESKLVTSGAVYSALSNKMDKPSGGKGSSTQGIYIDSNGDFKAMTYSVNKTVPSNAKFTDTTYSTTSSVTSGSSSLVTSGGVYDKFYNLVKAVNAGTINNSASQTFTLSSYAGGHWVLIGWRVSGLQMTSDKDIVGVNFNLGTGKLTITKSYDSLANGQSLTVFLLSAPQIS